MKCRIIELPIKNALYNTALDQFLLEMAEQGIFIIAFTRWKPSVLIGRSQSLALDVDREKCLKKGISIMRRFSGGQAVYLDDSYIVLVAAGPRSFFPVSLTELREHFCEACIKALKKFKVPADFFKPDNVVVHPGPRTLGNSGQVIKKNAVLVQASIRYDLTDEGLKTMLDVLKTNGQGLQKFFEPVKNALACVREFTDVGFNEIKAALIYEIVRVYGFEDCSVNNLSPQENSRIEELSDTLVSDVRLEDEPGYEPRGVCYFYLNGKCIVPEIADFLPQVSPSTHLDSTIS